MGGPRLLRRWRERAKLTQTEAAERVGATQPSWSEWEAGRKCPSTEMVIRIAQLTRDVVPITAWLNSRTAA